MNDQQILCFLTVAETLNFSTAAGKLYISQPAITYQIKSLEKELGVSLFHRTTISTELTTAGMAFLEDARQIHTAIEQARSHMQKLQEVPRMIFACPPTLIDYDNDLFVRIIKNVMQQTHIPMEGQLITDPHTSIRDLLSGRVQLVISARRHALPYQDKLRIEPMFHCQHYAMLAPFHPLSQKGSLSLSDLDQQTIYLIEEDTCYSPLVQSLIQSAMQNNRIAVTCQSIKTFKMAIPFVEMGHGLLLTTLRFHQSSDIVYRPVDLGEEMDLQICLCSSRQNTTPALRQACQIIRDSFVDYRDARPELSPEN